jgi:hypothetical protein
MVAAPQYRRPHQTRAIEPRSAQRRRPTSSAREALPFPLRRRSGELAPRSVARYTSGMDTRLLLAAGRYVDMGHLGVHGAEA